MGSFSSFFARLFRRGIIFLFAILVGAGIWGSSGFGEAVARFMPVAALLTFLRLMTTLIR